MKQFICTIDRKTPDARMPNSYSIEVDEQGHLLSVDGQNAVFKAGKKYRVGGETFGFEAAQNKLTRYDAAVGDVCWNCECVI